MSGLREPPIPIGITLWVLGIITGFVLAGGPREWRKTIRRTVVRWRRWMER